MILLFTDFGPSGPYIGQVKAAIATIAPDANVIDLLSDAPSFNPRASAYLLCSLAAQCPEGSSFLCVIDPGVGTSRRAVVVEWRGRTFVGPDNGLFNALCLRGSTAWREILWRPLRCSDTFHGRDIFAPVAAKLSTGAAVESRIVESPSLDTSLWPADLPEVIYVDTYGNAMTGVRASAISSAKTLRVNGTEFERVRTYADSAPGTPIWYENSNGLAELAVNQGSAARLAGLAVGDSVAGISDSLTSQA